MKQQSGSNNISNWAIVVKNQSLSNCLLGLLVHWENGESAIDFMQKKSAVVITVNFLFKSIHCSI